MTSVIEKLVKFLHLEAERGYDNRAVFGGLENMLEPWQLEAREANIPEPLIEVILTRLRDYPKLTPPSREEVIQGLWHRVAKEFPDLNVVGDELPTLHPEAVQSQSEPQDAPEEIVEEEIESAPPTPIAKPAGERKDPHSTDPSKIDSPVTAPQEYEAPRETPVALEASLTTFPGVGPKTARTLKKLGLETLEDLVWHLPRRYDDYSSLKTINRLWFGEEVTVIGTVEEIQTRLVRSGRMKLTEAVIGDGTGNLRITWFNQPWIADKLKPGKGVVLSGKVDQYLGRLTMSSPEWEPLERIQLHTNRIVPVYPLTAGVTGKWLRRVINSVVTRYALLIPESIPTKILQSVNLVPLSKALQQIHFPDNWDSLEKAQNRLAFDEMFLLQLGVLKQKREWAQLETMPLPSSQDQIDQFTTQLPFVLTDAQQKALEVVRQDLTDPQPMNRLLQGDVGSGKTVVAAGAIAITAANQSQSAFMAPTSILAEQHYLTISKLLTHTSGLAEDQIRLLLGSTPASEKEEIRNGLESGHILVLIGTHALLEDPIVFKSLRLAVIDEQHRFGVNQRAILRAKGDNPNLLVMTATPIPRSLSLTLYGDLDLSVIDEMPPGRKPTETRVLSAAERLRAYQFIRSQLEQGHQAFIIYPLVEESVKIDAKAAVEEHARLQNEVFPKYKVGLLHGRMRPDEKEAVMTDFRNGDPQVLVSTSVVEVGVDVPNTTVMLIEGANRFGLAQLHQFRGRVGRDDKPSYCLLIADSDEDSDNERLKAMERTVDGFELAEIDLNQRGPGDFLGTRQSGFAELKMAKLTDIPLIEMAREQAKIVFSDDPELSKPEHQKLADVVDHFWSDGKGDIS
jgi:ATP-dependent DNA helicase RecG